MDTIKQITPLQFYYGLSDRHSKWAFGVAKVFIKDDELVKKLLLKSEPYRYCLLESYKFFIHIEELISIEDLSQSDKMIIHEQAKDWCHPGVKKDLLVDISKCIHVLTYVLENKAYDIEKIIL